MGGSNFQLHLLKLIMLWEANGPISSRDMAYPR